MEMNMLQREVNEIRKSRRFTMEPLKIFTMLSEEVGEVASAALDSNNTST